MDLDKLPIHEFFPHFDDWFYRDSYSQVWWIERSAHPGMPLIVSLFKSLELPICFEHKGPN